MNKIETKILNCSAIREAEKNMVFTARLTQRGHLIHNMEELHMICPTYCSQYCSAHIFKIAIISRFIFLGV